MTIKDLKELEKLFKLCRKSGIKEMAIDGMSFKMDDLPVEMDLNEQSMLDDPMPPNPYMDFPQEVLTPDQLAHYAAGGKPEDDPARNN